MFVRCGWASIDERGHASGGAAGDQTGREVKTGNWYQFGQTMVIRPKSRDLGKKMAKVCRKLCEGDLVGYDQSQRTTLYMEMSKVGWNVDKLKKKCETDCSAMMAVVCKACGVDVSPDVWTGNLWAALARTKKFEKLTSAYYVKSSKGLRAGDIVLNPERHVIMVIADGPVARGQEGLNRLVGAKLKLDGHAGLETKQIGVEALKVGLNKDFDLKLEVDSSYDKKTKAAVDKHPVRPGMTGKEVEAVQCLLYCKGYNPNGIDGHYGPGMKTAVGQYQADNGLVPDHSVGPKTMLRLLS